MSYSNFMVSLENCRMLANEESTFGAGVKLEFISRLRPCQQFLFRSHGFPGEVVRNADCVYSCPGTITSVKVIIIIE